MPLVETRYAEALIEISSQNGMVDAYENELEFIRGVYKKETDFRGFSLNPGIRTELKRDLVSKVFAGRIKTELLNFLLLLVDKNRIGFLEGIVTEYGRLADKLGNVLQIEITSAGPLDHSQAEQIKDIYRKEYGASAVRADIKTDASLIGGVMVKIGDKVIDGTVKGRLATLRESVMEA